MIPSDHLPAAVAVAGSRLVLPQKTKEEGEIVIKQTDKRERNQLNTCSSCSLVAREHLLVLYAEKYLVSLKGIV